MQRSDDVVSLAKPYRMYRVAGIVFAVLSTLLAGLCVGFWLREGSHATTKQWTFREQSYAGTLLEKVGSEHETLCDPTVKNVPGYFKIEGKEEKHYFYWFFESRSSPSTDPLVIWLTGGPGCSSQLALFVENGPCSVALDGKSTINNPYSWTSNANVMWIDQPAEVGFSFNNDLDRRYIDRNEEEVSEDMYHFLQSWFRAHPEFRRREFYIFGESYAGHFVPAIAHRVYLGNRHAEGIHINLAGIGIGNGLTNPVIQYEYYADFAYNNTYGNKLVDEHVYNTMKANWPACRSLVEACQLDKSKCSAAYVFCNDEYVRPIMGSGYNPYDVRVKCGATWPMCYNFTHIDTFLNNPITRSALGIPDRVPVWKACNRDVTTRFALVDFMSCFHQKIPALLHSGVRVLVYAGDADFMCNAPGNRAWTLALNWRGKAAFNAAPEHEWVANGKVAGEARTAEGLTFLRLNEAGHMAPLDQPQVTLEMLNTFLNHDEF